MTTTTIRVPRELHDRLARRAAQSGSSLSGAIERALEAEERAEFWDEVESTMGSAEVRAVIRADSAALAGTMSDGLDPDESWDDVL